jgi:hypothetical protein
MYLIGRITGQPYPKPELKSLRGHFFDRMQILLIGMIRKHEQTARLDQHRGQTWLPNIIIFQKFKLNAIAKTKDAHIRVVQWAVLVRLDSDAALIVVYQKMIAFDVSTSNPGRV